jgi:hypothetical protein
MRGGRGGGGRRLPPIYHNITYIIKPAAAFDLPLYGVKRSSKQPTHNKNISTYQSSYCDDAAAYRPGKEKCGGVQGRSSVYCLL